MRDDAGKLDVIGIALYVFGAYEIAIGLFMVVAPGTFYEQLAPFGARSDHFLQDLAAYQFPFGLLFIAAARNPAWRVLALAFGTVQGIGHSISPLVDIHGADPKHVGTFDFVAVLFQTAILGWLLYWARKPEPAATA